MAGQDFVDASVAHSEARARYARQFVAEATVKQLQSAMASGELPSRPDQAGTLASDYRGLKSVIRLVSGFFVIRVCLGLD
ncbi:MAG TPA: hypothetical protein V6C99_10290 [Oculatellaceae cyanobacterium]